MKYYTKPTEVEAEQITKVGQRDAGGCVPVITEDGEVHHFNSAIISNTPPRLGDYIVTFVDSDGLTYQEIVAARAFAERFQKQAYGKFLKRDKKNVDESE